MKFALRMVLFASVVLFVAWYGRTVVFNLSSVHWPIELVSVEGRLNAGEQQQIRDVIAVHLNKGFLFVSLDDVVDSVMDLSWPREVEVRRNWPGNLLLSVTKQSIVARWNDAEYLSTSGQVVSDPDSPGEQLPKFYAQHSDGIKTMGIYRDLNRVIESDDQSGNLKIVELREDNQGIWQIELKSGLVVTLGRKTLNARLARFVNVYNQSLHQHKERLISADARYRNGIAIKWMDLPLKDELVTLATGHR